MAGPSGRLLWRPATLHELSQQARAELARAAGRPADVVRLLREESAQSIPRRAVPAERLLFVSEPIDPARLSQIRSDLESLARQDPQNFETWITRGNWFARLGRTSDAVESYGVAIAMAPHRFWTYLHRGLLFLDLRNFSRAVADFDQMIALRPDWPEAYLNRAIAKLELGDLTGSVEDLDRCLANDGRTGPRLVRPRPRESESGRSGRSASRPSSGNEAGATRSR